MGENKELLSLMELCGHFLYHRRGGKRGQTRILRLLYEHGEMSQRQLQDILDIKSGSLSEIVRKMETEGLILRQKHPEDRRNIMIRITEKGIQTCLETTLHLQEEERILFEALSRQEQQQLFYLLSKLLIDWKDHFEQSLFQHRKPASADDFPENTNNCSRNEGGTIC
ncbi:MAG: MarR family transcriptional regulator [Lachnospiraceae bacterium]|nr:MarR family transcriptional regulator [Lachnospiraceae bacterium]